VNAQKGEGSLKFAWWIPQLRDEVLIEVISHATTAKDAKVNKKKAIRSDLSGLCVMSSSQPRSPRAQRLRTTMGYVADPAKAG